jgi:hypothetical protein
MIADGGDALTHLATLRDQSKLFGAVASEPTAWRAVDRVDDAHLSELRAVRATARERAWAAGAGPDVSAGLVIDLDATITIAHSERMMPYVRETRTPVSRRTSMIAHAPEGVLLVPVEEALVAGVRIVGPDVGDAGDQVVADRSCSSRNR